MDFQEGFEKVYQVLLEGATSEATPLRALWADEHALRYLATQCSQTRLSNDGIAIVRPLDRLSKTAPLPHVSAIVFSRPDSQCIAAVESVLASSTRRFRSLKLVFTQEVPDDVLERIARADIHKIVSEIRVVFANCVPILQQMLIVPQERNGLESAILAIGRQPTSVRY